MKAARVDTNQPAIVGALRAYGATVQHLHKVGDGCPDLLVGYMGKDGIRRNFLLEVKDGGKPPSKRNLTPQQKVWHASWRGTVDVVKNIEDALKVIGVK